MTDEQLRSELEPLLLANRDDLKAVSFKDQLMPLARRFLDGKGDKSIEHTFDRWNNVMADLVIEHNL